MSASQPLLAVLSDPHIGASWAERDPPTAFAAAVESVRRLNDPPDALLLCGDLADHGEDAEYEQLRALLAPLSLPTCVLAGNHDDREALRRHFGAPGAEGSPLQYAAPIGALRLIVLDSTRRGSDAGELDGDRLDWLEAELAGAPDTPTLIALHHPPIATGLPGFDAIGLPPGEREALGTIVERHSQVRALTCGHVHRTIAGQLAGRPVLVVPSTLAQAELDFTTMAPRFGGSSSGYAIYALREGELIAHVEWLEQ